ncbi:MAG: creatininase family protein [Clostridia bacterium]|nr:creatininase family protein [Clostridia bacterium]
MFLERMSYPDVEKYLSRKDTVVIPVGSLESHGKHMPLGTDTIIPNRIAELLEERFPDVVIAPTLPYGATDDLRGFAGTVSLGVEGLRAVLQTICDQLFEYGFRRFIILNGHGGNVKSIEQVGIKVFERGGYLAIVNWWLIAGQIRPEWKGGHGGAEETAGVMAVDPTLIHSEYLTLGECIRNDISDELPSTSWTSVEFKGGMVTVPRHVNSITDNGWLAHGMGSDVPTNATREWGVEMLDAMADYIRDFIGALERAPLPKADGAK